MQAIAAKRRPDQLPNWVIGTESRHQPDIAEADYLSGVRLGVENPNGPLTRMNASFSTEGLWLILEAQKRGEVCCQADDDGCSFARSCDDRQWSDSGTDGSQRDKCGDERS
jgi:hypothetical protein